MSMAARTHPSSVKSFLLLAALLLSPACRSGPPPIEEYLLSTNAPEAGAHAAGSRLAALRVKPLVARGFLDRKEIAWREGDVRCGAYHYRRWCEPPAEAVTRLLIDTLRARGTFEQVDGAAPRAAGPFTLSGELLGLHEETDESGEHPAGIAEIELVLETAGADPADAPTRRVLRARAAVAARDGSMEMLVRALDEALELVFAELAPQVEAAAAAGVTTR